MRRTRCIGPMNVNCPECPEPMSLRMARVVVREDWNHYDPHDAISLLSLELHGWYMLVCRTSASSANL